MPPEPRRPHRPRLAFSGVGWIGRNRMKTLVKRGVADATVIYDPDPDAALAAARMTGAKVVDDFDALLDQDLDGVVIATPNDLHASQSIAAFERGLPVFCQKPLGRTSKEVERVVDAAHTSDRLLGVDLSYRHVRAIRVMRELMRQGAIGAPYALELTFHNAYGPGKQWFYDRNASGGGCFLDLGIHLVDLALWLQDFPRVTHVTSRLFANGEGLDAKSERVEDYATARIDFETGTTAQVTTSWGTGAGVDAVINVTVHGNGGTLRMRNVEGSYYDFMAERLDGNQRQTIVRPPDHWSGRAAVRWAYQLRDGPRFVSEAHRHVSVAHVLDQVYGR